MVQDPLESLSKVSITVRSCKINASVPNYREVAENPPCISQVPFVPSTTGKKHGLSKIVCVCVAHTWQQAASRQNIVRSAVFFFFPSPNRRLGPQTCEGGLVWHRLFLPIPQSRPSRAARPRFFDIVSREKRALCE